MVYFFRYTLFKYCCPDCNCLTVNPHVGPHLPVPDHHHHPHVNPSCSGSACVVAPFLLQMNIGANDTTAVSVRQVESDQPSTFCAPSNLVTDVPELSVSSTHELCATVNMTFNFMNKAPSNCSDKGNSENDSSELADVEKGGSNCKKNRRKKSKKKKKTRMKGGPKAVISETQIGSFMNSLEKPSASSEFTSHSLSKTFMMDGDREDQSEKSGRKIVETVPQCSSNNSHNRCHEEGDHIELVLPEVIKPRKDIDKANMTHCSSTLHINNDFVLSVDSGRGHYSKRSSQQGGNYSRSASFSGGSSERLSSWQEKPLKIKSADVSGKKIEASGKLDLEHDANPCLTKSIPTKSNEDARHLGECLFKKEDFPSLSPASNLKEAIRHNKVVVRHPLVDNLPGKSHEECKESTSNVTEIKPTASNLETKICIVVEPDSSISGYTKQSSHGISTVFDSPTSSNDSHGTHSNEGQNVTQSGHVNISVLDPNGDKSSIDVAQLDHDTRQSDFKSTTSTNIDDSMFGSSMCSSLANTAPMSPSTSTSCPNITEPKKIPTVYSNNLDEIQREVQASQMLRQRVEMAQVALGGPLADYELLCRYASPVVKLPPNEIASMQLQKIWQWYEEPSCYALEVRGCRDHRYLMDFSAHFVPSLSAVQLFLRRGTVDGLGQSAGSADLVFQFFEYEQPYNRRPLFDK